MGRLFHIFWNKTSLPSLHAWKNMHFPNKFIFPTETANLGKSLFMSVASSHRPWWALGQTLRNSTKNIELDNRKWYLTSQELKLLYINRLLIAISRNVKRIIRNCLCSYSWLHEELVPNPFVVFWKPHSKALMPTEQCNFSYGNDQWHKCRQSRFGELYFKTALSVHI